MFKRVHVHRTEKDERKEILITRVPTYPYNFYKRIAKVEISGCCVLIFIQGYICKIRHIYGGGSKREVVVAQTK